MFKQARKHLATHVHMNNINHKICPGVSELFWCDACCQSYMIDDKIQDHAVMNGANNAALFYCCKMATRLVYGKCLSNWQKLKTSYVKKYQKWILVSLFSFINPNPPELSVKLTQKLIQTKAKRWLTMPMKGVNFSWSSSYLLFKSSWYIIWSGFISAEFSSNDLPQNVTKSLQKEK